MLPTIHLVVGRTPVAVVCAGVKSILDIGRTLEVLETQGVPVLTLGCDDFPAFFTRKSGFVSPLSIGSKQDIAKVIASQLSLPRSGGVLLAVPIPKEAEAEAAAIQVRCHD